MTIYTDTIPIFSSAMRNSGMSRLVVMSGWPITSKDQWLHRFR